MPPSTGGHAEPPSMDTSWQCPRPSHARPLRGPCYPDTWYPASSELECQLLAPFASPGKIWQRGPRNGLHAKNGRPAARFLTLALYVFVPPSPNQGLCSPGTHLCPQGVSFRSSFRTAKSYRGTARSQGRQGTARARLPARHLWASLPHGLGHHQRALACTHRPDRRTPGQRTQARPTAAPMGTVAQERHKAGGRGLFIESHRMKQGLCSQVPRYGFC